MAIINGTPAGETLNGTAANDTITGKEGDDTLLGSAGNDLFVWNPGDGSDTIDGEADVDSLRFIGSVLAETFSMGANGLKSRLTRDVGAIVMDMDNVEVFELRTLGGADSVTVDDFAGSDVTKAIIDLAAVSGGAVGDGVVDAVSITGKPGDDDLKVASVGAAIVVTGMQAEIRVLHADKTDSLTLEGGVGNDLMDASKLAAGKAALALNGGVGDDNLTGGAGNDAIDGGDGNDTVSGGAGGDLLAGGSDVDALLGGAGNDTVTGDAGNDTALLGAGNDRFIWDPGDGSDTVEGQAGTDTLDFTGAAAAEIFAASANGGRVLFTRNVGNIVMDLDDVEHIKLQALGGVDTIVVNDLSGTDLKLMAIDLAGPMPGSGDGAVDDVTVNGSNGNNTVKIAVIGDEVAITGLAATTTIANSEAANDGLAINALDGKDKIDASKLTAGKLSLAIDGGDGNDTVIGSAAADALLGGDGDDTITGKAGNDTAFLGVGKDLFTWNPGDGSDIVEGQDDLDTLRMIGSDAPETFAVSANGGRVLLTRDIGNIVMDIDDVEHINVRALGGADTIFINDLSGTDATEVAVDLAATLNGALPDKSVDTVAVNGTIGVDAIAVALVAGKIVTTGLPAQVVLSHASRTDLLALNGGAGNDVINAGALPANRISLQLNGDIGDDVLFGSAGNDVVNGGDGSDTAFLGAGDDEFIWDPGDDSDTIEGQTGTDTLRFNGANVAESVDISANGGRALLFRDISSVTMDVNDVERIEFQAVGGADTITVNDLNGTDVKQVALNLAASGGGGDGQVDTVIRNAGAGDDTVNVALAGASVSVTGLSAQLIVAEAEATDVLIVNGLGGNDTINGSKLTAGIMALTLDGGTGNDVIVGSQGADALLGGNDNDTLTGGAGADVAFLGSGNDLFLWNAGDGSDTVEGQGDFDTLRMTGFNGDENIDISANGGRARLFRDVAAAALDLDDVERLELRTLGGTDNIVVGDLTGTDVTEVAIDLAATAGGKVADTKIDTVTVNATAGADALTVATSGGKIAVTGLATTISLDHFGKTDQLVINGDADNDVINASGLAAGLIDLRLLGGIGVDLIVGSAGNDAVTGGDGDDTALLGAGNDRFIWNPGDDNDIIEGQAGTDTLEFNGNNVSEVFDIAANGGRVRFFRDVASVQMDLNDLERIQLQALGGIDILTVNDLGGTDLKLLALDLAGTVGGTIGDGSADSITQNATAGNDVITLASLGGDVSVIGLAAQLTIAHAEIGSDRLLVNGLAGDDKINAATLPAATIQVTLDGGDGNDTLTGNAADNLLIGGADNDVLNGNGGNDVLTGGDGKDAINGGAGNDTVTGGLDDDAVNVAAGNDVVRYTSVLDGHDIVTGFDGNAAGGQDTLDLDALFDALAIAQPNRAGRISITDNGASVEIAVDTDGNASFDLVVATLKTSDIITVGADIIVGS